jgi:Sigma-70 region 2
MTRAPELRIVSNSGRPDVDLDRLFREEHGRVVATLVRHFGDIDVAEDAAQEAFVIALQRWPESGLPPNPGGWLTTTARNRAIDPVIRDAPGTGAGPTSTHKCRSLRPLNQVRQVAQWVGESAPALSGTSQGLAMLTDSYLF